MQFFVGVDWAEDHHDVCVVDTEGRVRSRGRVSNDLAGIAKIHDLIDWPDSPARELAISPNLPPLPLANAFRRAIQLG